MKAILLTLLTAAVWGSLAHAAVTDINPDAQYPEGPVWYRGKLNYVGYARNAIMTWDGNQNSVFATQMGCEQSAVIPTSDGEFLTTCGDNNTIGRMSAKGKQLEPYTHDKDGNTFVMPNDFAPDARGGIYFTTSGNTHAFSAAAEEAVARTSASAAARTSGRGQALLYCPQTAPSHKRQPTDMGPMAWPFPRTVTSFTSLRPTSIGWSNSVFCRTARSSISSFLSILTISPTT